MWRSFAIIVSQNGTIKVASVQEIIQAEWSRTFSAMNFESVVKQGSEKMSYLSSTQIRLCSLLQHIMMDRDKLFGFLQHSRYGLFGIGEI